jgi:hypothetical protein
LDNRLKQKEAELKALKLWLRVAEDIPKGRLVSYESPDFLYFTSTKLAIGIEICGLTMPQNELLLLQDRKFLADWFMQRMNGLIAKKISLIPLYKRNPQISEIWLIICGDAKVYELIHRQLAKFRRMPEENTFSRIDLFFPERELVFRI